METAGRYTSRGLPPFILKIEIHEVDIVNSFRVYILLLIH
jgi:hypothetical protein